MWSAQQWKHGHSPLLVLHDGGQGEREILHRHVGAVTCMTVDWTAICVATGARDTLIKITRLAAGVDRGIWRHGAWHVYG